MEKVKADVQCPCCGFCKVMKLKKTQKGLFCPGCDVSLFLRWATGVEGELDEDGYYFYAHEAFLGDERVKEMNALFEV